MDAKAHREHGGERMVMIGSADEDGIDLLAHLRIELTVVVELPDVREISRRGNLLHFPEGGHAHFGIWIDKGDDLFLHNRFHQLLHSPTTANHSHADLLSL